MIPNLSSVFTKYEQLVHEVDSVFERVNKAYPECVKCHAGCSDCCNALFDLSLVEAMYLNMQFRRRYGYGPERSAILSSAAKTDRDLTVLKRGYYRSTRDKAKLAVTEEQAHDILHGLMKQAAHDRVRCPLLNDKDTCLLYDVRPITCRLYGIPTAIEGKGYVCGMSGFDLGKGYPTVKMDKIQDRLDELSFEIQKLCGSRFKELHTVFSPVSMALLTNYDEAYLGIGPAPDESKEF